jgi:hypothetical protein
VAIGVLAPALLLSGAAVAAAGSGDEAATHSYLLARLSHRAELAGQAGDSLTAIHALAARLRSECPGILTGTPLAPVEGGSGDPEADLRLEIADAAFGASERLEHAADVRFYDRVKHLHWHHRKLTTLVHELALEEDLQSGLPEPEVCADIRFWVASGYKSASPGTLRSRHEHDVVSSTAKIEVGPGESGLDGVDGILAHRLAPFENAADRRLARRVFPRGRSTGTPAQERAVKKVFAAIEEVLTVLGKSVSA